MFGHTLGDHASAMHWYNRDATLAEKHAATARHLALWCEHRAMAQTADAVRRVFALCWVEACLEIRQLELAA